MKFMFFLKPYLLMASAISFVGFAIVPLTTGPMHQWGTAEALFLVAIVLSLGLNILWLLKSKVESGEREASWLELYFRRKALEEKARIRELEKS